LGSAAGGGYPQWNCNGEVSRAAWENRSGAKRRTQSSIAVSADGAGWVLFNASPDIREQIGANRFLQPDLAGPPRNSPVRAVVLTNADVDHIAGLLSLRERHRFTLHATARVLGALADNPVFGVLDPAYVRRELMEIDRTFEVEGLRITPFAVPGKVALYLEDASRGPGFGTQEGDTIGVEVAGPEGGRLLYVPGCAAIDARFKARAEGADLLLLDGTLFTDDEMVRAGLSDKTGARMGHVSMSGENGSIAALAGTRVGRRAFIHINCTNPALLADSPERAFVEAAGWDISEDGQDFSL
jgi:pyrroloquinoline quinone biosynthesis protein B